MQFVKARARHIAHIAHWWWALIYGGIWSLICAVDVFIEHYGSDSVKAAYNNVWIAPKWGWKVWIIGLLAITLLVVLEGSYRHNRVLQEKLDGAPKLVCKGASFHGNILVGEEITGSPPIPTGRQMYIGAPVFYHLRITNEPTGVTDRKTAEKVAARVQICNEDGTPAARDRLHRWEDSPGPIDVGKRADREIPLDIPPSGVEYCLDIAMKYREDDDFYTPNNETALRGSRDWREDEFRFPPGTYIADVHLRGVNVSKDLRCRIINSGRWQNLEIIPLGGD